MFAKYLHAKGDWRRFALYGIHLFEIGWPIVLVEGTFDAINLWRHGVRNPIAILGSAANEEQIALIKKLEAPIYVMGDGDKAGRALNQKIIKRFEAEDIEVTPLLLEEGVDPGSLSKEEVDLIFPSSLRLF